ncbi:MAG: HEAT repeat domain-containing protein, partial [Halobacteriota archaeon]
MTILNLDEPNVDELRRARDLESLTKVLQFSPKWRDRSHAAIALGKLADRRATEPLIAALNDRDESVRQMAAEALG